MKMMLKVQLVLVSICDLTGLIAAITNKTANTAFSLLKRGLKRKMSRKDFLGLNPDLEAGNKKSGYKVVKQFPTDSLHPQGLNAKSVIAYTDGLDEKQLERMRVEAVKQSNIRKKKLEQDK